MIRKLNSTKNGWANRLLKKLTATLQYNLLLNTSSGAVAKSLQNSERGSAAVAPTSGERSTKLSNNPTPPLSVQEE